MNNKEKHINYNDMFSELKILHVFSYTFFLIVLLPCQHFAQPELITQKGPHSLKTPQYRFAQSLEEQEAQLKNNPLMLRFADSRERLADDRYRTLYHFVSLENMLNDVIGKANSTCFIRFILPTSFPIRSTQREVVLDGFSTRLNDVWVRPPEMAIMSRGDEMLKFRVFVDKSVVEVFVNGRQYLAMRVYPGRKDSVEVSLLAQGQDAVLKSLDAWQMKSIWSHEETEK